MQNQVSNDKAKKENESKNVQKRSGSVHRLESLSPLSLMEVGSGNTFGIPNGCVPCFGLRLQP